MSNRLHTSPRDRIVTAACQGLTRLFDLGYRLLRQPDSGVALRRFQRPRILILKPCCMGDVIMSTATVRALRDAFPQASITYAVGDWSRSPLAGNPHLNALLDTGGVGTGRFNLKAYIDLIRRVRRGRYDACFVLERSPLLAMVPWLAGIPIRAGIHSRGRGFALTKRVKWEPEQPRHEVELYLQTVRACGIDTGSPSLEVFPNDGERSRARQLLEDAGVGNAHPLIVLHTGGGINPGTILTAKRWNPENFAALADRLIEELSAKILFIGGKTDREPTDIALAAMQRREQAVDLVGRTNSMGELAALYELADCFAGNDSGTMHLACATQIPVVAIFGPSDPRMYAPYTSRGVALSAGDYVAKGRSGFAGSDDPSLRPSVPVEAVYEAVVTFLKSSLGKEKSPIHESR